MLRRAYRLRQGAARVAARTGLLLCVAAALLLSFTAVARAQASPAAGRDAIDVGWHDDFRSDRGWRPEPWQVDRPDAHCRASYGRDGATFEIVSPGTAMAWTRTTNPVWVRAFGELEVDCTVSGASPDGYPQLLLFDDSTGPVTPNALNPENPMAGEHEALLTLQPVNGVQRFDLSRLFPSDRVARITLRLAAGKQPASVAVRRIAFRASRTAPVGTHPAASTLVETLLPAVEQGGSESAWQPLDLPAGPFVEAADIAEALGCSLDWPTVRPCRFSDIPFHLGPVDRAAVATGVMEENAIEITGRWQGCELALVLGSRLFGSEVPWYAPTTVRNRTAITSPHQFVVQLGYSDGTRDAHFPRPVPGGSAQVTMRPAVYVVPVNADKTLTSISLVDRMSYGQVFLIAAGLNGSRDPVYPAPPSAVAKVSPRVASLPLAGQVRIRRTGTEVHADNRWFRLVCDASRGLRVKTLELLPFDRQIVRADSDSHLVELRDRSGAGIAMSLADADTAQTPDDSRLSLSWNVGAPSDRHVLTVTLAADPRGGIQVTARLRNDGPVSWAPVVHVPALRNASASSEPADAHYLVGLRNALLGNQDTRIDKPYGAPWPLQIVDLFAPRQGGGLGMFIVDPYVLAKRVRFAQTCGKANVAFCYDYLNLPPGATVELPTAVLLPHVGDWHDTFAAYRDRLRDAGLVPAPDTPPHALGDAFYCRRDYPLGGTNYLFDVAHRTYTPDLLIDESRRAFGGLDLIDISGWAYNEKTGRVGDYLTNDLGGLEAVRELAAKSHGTGKRVGLYFEGFLIDRRCALAARAMPGWQMILENGKPRWWAGDMEFFACPGVRAWQEELAGAMAEVAAVTGVDAVYADEFGISTMDRACWSPDHGHPVPSNPLYDEREMLGIFRSALKAKAPNTAVYTEYPPADGLARLVDGAFDIALFDANPGQHPTELLLYRYVFPHVAIFQMAGHGIRPVPFEADELHRMVFHGQGPWLKGRGESWFTTGLREFAARAYPMFVDHGPLFRSADCEPLIPTLARDLHANRFTSGGRTIYTLYNAGLSTVRGDLLEVLPAAPGNLTDLLSGSHAELVNNGDRLILRGQVDPGSTAAVLIVRQN